MSKKHNNFGVGTRKNPFTIVAVSDGNFDYHEKIAVETSQKDFRDFWIRPTGGITQIPFSFTIDPMIERYLQLNNAGIEATLRVVRTDGTYLSPWEDIVAPINLLGTCMWEQIEVIVNDRRFAGASEVNCSYKAFIEAMLSYDTDARSTHIHSQFFHLDSPGQFGNMAVSENQIKRALFNALEQRIDFMPNDVPVRYQAGDHTAELILIENQRRAELPVPQPAVPPGWRPPTIAEDVKTQERFRLYNAYWASLKAGVMKPFLKERENDLNMGFDSRFRVVSGSDSFDVYTPITHDFFQLNNHVGPNNRINLRLTPQKNSFILNSYLTDKNYKLQIVDLKLHLHTIDRKDSIPSPMIETYLMTETQMHKKLIAAGASLASFRVHENGIMPKSLVIAMVTSKAADGSYKENPFYFHHFFMKKICLYINGEQYPSGGIEADFTKPNAHVSRLYRWMFENTGAAQSNRGNMVAWSAFQAGCTIIPFNLDPDKCNGLHFHNGEKGVIDLQIDFSIELSESIYVLYELVYPKVVVNDKINGHMDILDIVAG